MNEYIYSKTSHGFNAQLDGITVVDDSGSKLEIERRGDQCLIMTEEGFTLGLQYSALRQLNSLLHTMAAEIKEDQS